MYIMLFWVCTDFCVYDFGARPDRRPGGGVFGCNKKNSFIKRAEFG